MEPIIALDIGGTKLSAALYQDGELSCFEKCSTEAKNGPDGVLDSLLALVDNIKHQAKIGRIAAVGVACPGPLIPSTGLIVRAPTLGWRNFPLKDRMQERLGCPVVVENDANAAAWGEFCRGAGQGCKDMAYLTLSTGVGCGLIVNGRLVYGKHEGAGELGHLHMQDGGETCVCGRDGCLEAYASGTGLAKIARRELGIADARQLAEAARQGNEQAAALYRQAGSYLGKAIAALEMLNDTDRFVIGGSVSAQLNLMLPSLLEAVERYSYWGQDTEERIVLAALGERSGLMGAALLGEKLLKELDGRKGD